MDQAKGAQVTRKPDPDARATEAREALQRLPGALERTWELRYEQGWQPEAPTPSRPAPGWRPHWTGATHIERSYQDAVAHLARAHWHLERDTDCEELWLPGNVANLPAEPVENGYYGRDTGTYCARSVPLGEAKLAVALLERALTELHQLHREAVLVAPEVNALMKACDEAEAALNELPDGLRREPKGCRVKGCQRMNETHRTTCRKHRADRVAA